MELMPRVMLVGLSLFLASACAGGGTDGVATTDGGAEPLRMIEYGGELTGGEPRSFRFWTHCGMERLGKFNGEEWLLSGDSPDGNAPAGWNSYMDATADEEIVLRLELTDDGTVTARPVDAPTDQEVEYEPTTEPNPGCD